jgi:prepilin-type processing-associated H-X9-DG protein
VGVTAAFDLNLLPFYRIKGQEWPQLPGLLTMAPPRRTARGRENDRLVIYLTFSGNDPFSANEYNQTGAQMARQFYQIPGSVTSAIRSVAETLNQLLVDRNLRTTGKGQYIIGRMILGVIHGSQFVFAQCGPTHVFHLAGKDVRQVHDAQISGRGLGIGQATPLYFSQLDINPGDQLVLCADLPSGWETAILGTSLATTDSLRRELLTVTTDDLNAVQVEVLPGKGNLNISKAIPAAVPDAAGQKRQPPVADRSDKPAAVPAGSQAAPESLPSPINQAVKPVPSQAQASEPSSSPEIPTSQVDSGQPASRFARLLSGSDTEQSAATTEPEIPIKIDEAPVTPGKPRVPLVSAKPVPPSGIAQKPAASRPAAQTGRFVSGRLAGELPEIKRPITHRKGIYRGLANIIQGVRGATQKISRGLRKFLPNLLPNSNEVDSQDSGSSLAFVAIAIPVIVVTIAGLVYARYGRVTQYNDYYSMAMVQAAQAHGQTDPAEVRRAWDSTLYYLDLADRYQVTQDSQNLRQEAQTALDNLDSIVRLSFSPAIVGGLDRTLQIDRMAATNTDLYLLDAAHGNVIRATLGSQGYEVDTGFVCGPGQYGTLTVGKLLDIEALQMSNDYNARVMGIDSGGTLLYCGFNMTPEAVPLSPPPLGWQGITAFSLDTDGKFLYVLDPLGNNVWAYQGSSGKFTDSPTLFFGQQVPQSMSTSIDLAANNSDLYILFADGHVTSCPASHFAGVPLRCADPLTFVDNRPERQPGPRINDAVFNQMSFATAPDPLLYLLEPLTRAVYFFSPRSGSLELRGQFRASVEQSNVLFNGSATAMTISPNRNLFFSIGSQVFYASNVP